ncbi:MAG: nucleotidyltransferase domain-containing protein [Candidatus Caenarcaniphilales bacterium]|nr:nucleotidyltransferase domain-containing protein [Candidatus Caenarcaniphilales bacterium]
MDQSELIKILSAKKSNYEKKYGFTEMLLFGSYASNSATDKSDVDIAVKVDKGFKTYRNFIDAKTELSHDLGDRGIDLVYLDAINLNPIIKDAIEQESLKIE